MKLLNKKIISLFCLLIATGPLLFVLFSSIKGKEIHLRMREMLKSNKLQTITLREESIVWLEEDEIWVNNSLFDIKSKESANGTYTFTGLFDNEEMELVKRLQHTTEEDREEQKILIELFECLQNIFHSNTPENYSQQYNQDIKYFCSNSQLAYLSTDVITPPPQV